MCSATRSLPTLVALSAALLSGVRMQAQQDTRLLESHAPIQRQLAPGDEHRYELLLAAGDFVRVIVEQRGIDVAVRSRDEAGATIAEFQEEIRPRGEEPIEIVAEKQGTYTLAIVPAYSGPHPGKYAIRIEERRKATDTDRALQESRKLRTSAVGLMQAGRFADATLLFERALTLREALRGADDTGVAVLNFELAGAALERHDDATARRLYERAIGTFDKVWGADHPYPAMARSRLALLYEHAGEGPKAEAILRESLAIIERTLGTDHLWYAQCLITQATVRADAGDAATAESLDRRALAILEQTGESDSAPYAAVLNNLGEVYRERGDNEHAKDLFLRSLAIAEKLHGVESYRVSTSLQNLGIIARDQRDYPKAFDYDLRALAMRERIVGADHPGIAPLLNNLAVLYRTTGDEGRALPLHFRALAIWEKTLGPFHRGTLTSVGNIARTYASLGDIPRAVAFERRADAIVEKQLALNLATGSERQKLAFVRSMSQRTDRTLSLHLAHAPADPDAGSLAALVLLQRKGRVQDAMIDAFAAVRQRAGSADRALLDELNETTAQLARRLNIPDTAGPDQQRAAVAALEARKEQFEATLSEHSAEFRAQTRPVTLEAVQAAIPDDAALLEFAVYRPFDPGADRNAEAYGPARYAAYVLRRDGPPRGFDLGPAATLDAAIRALRDALRDPRSVDVQARARVVDSRVMEPLRASLGDASRLLVAPDGDLNLVPFEALADEQKCYLIERYAITYLTSGRDLLRMQIPRGTAGPSLIVADPLFGEPSPRRPRPSSTPGVQMSGRSVTTGADLSTTYFAPLGASAEEARAIKALFPEATLLTGARATKAALHGVKAPRILHIASHGFFLDDGAPGTPAAGAPPNPLLRSGLAFAGANLMPNGHGDGILTALEASGLDLWGTRLVTLSACDTGVGEVRNGEGVYGLRRAFVLAGAETLVMGLWPVSDHVARDVMVATYKGLRAGLGRGEALRQAKLAQLKDPRRRHPYYWASFIQSGEWAGLDGRR